MRPNSREVWNVRATPARAISERAVAAGVDEIVALFTSSDAYARKNQNMTVAENLRAVHDVAAVADRAGVPLLVSMGLTMFCPYEGVIPAERVYDQIDRMREWGVSRLTFASSVGVDGPLQVRSLAAGILARWPDMVLGYHLHNTNGLGAANILAALEGGVRAIETSIGGIGGGIRMPRGMPYFGNSATEDLVQMLAEMGVRTGVELVDILEASGRIQALLELDEVASFAARGGTRDGVRVLGSAGAR